MRRGTVIGGETGMTVRTIAIVAGFLFVGATAHAQGIVSNHPPLSPEEAVAVLRGSQSLADHTDRQSVSADGPTVYVMRGNAADGPYGGFPRQHAQRRLDGTWLDSPPWEQYAYVGPYYGTRPDRLTHGRGIRVSQPAIRPAFSPLRSRAARASTSDPETSSRTERQAASSGASAARSTRRP